MRGPAADRSPTAPEVSHYLRLSYLGTPYAGWQRQAGQETVQGNLEAALTKIFRRPISAQASGRTDTGVHALGQVVSFDAPRLLPGSVLVRAVNAHLPQPIRVTYVRLMPYPFHARFDSIGKTYRYEIWNHPVQDPFRLDRAWHLPRPLDLTAMRQAARLLVGEHDFASFTSNPGYERASTVRHIRALNLSMSDSLLRLEITADGFLYRMVRNIIGALVKVGHARISVAEFAEVLAARRRSAAPNTAPACGLYLLRVKYPNGPVEPEPAHPSRPTRAKKLAAAAAEGDAE